MTDDNPGMIQFRFRLDSTHKQRVADRLALQQHGTLKVSSHFVDRYCLVVSEESSTDEVGAAVRALESIDADTVEVRR